MFILRSFAILLIAQNAFAGYDQWMELTIENAGKDPIHVTGNLAWGKWYKMGDKDQEVRSPHDLIQFRQKFLVSTCGRSHSASGTEGNILIWDSLRRNRLVTVNFDCPWSGSNNFTTRLHRPYVQLHHSSWSEVGALGSVSLRVFHSQATTASERCVWISEHFLRLGDLALDWIKCCTAGPESFIYNCASILWWNLREAEHLQKFCFSIAVSGVILSHTSHKNNIFLVKPKKQFIHSEHLINYHKKSCG